MTEHPCNPLALCDAKHRARHLLIERFSHGQIDVDELERSLERLEHADVMGADFGSGSGDITTAFATNVRTGPWKCGRRVGVLAVFGDVTVDFTTAQLEPGTTLVDLAVTCAVARILVPIGLAVGVDVQTFLGSFKRDRRIPEIPFGAEEPSLLVTGQTLFGRLDLCLAERAFLA